MAREEQKMRSELVRQDILDTALEIGIKEGFEAVSIRKIINKMKYSTGVIYHHFKDRQEIIDAIETAETDRFRSIIGEIADDAKDIVFNMREVFHRVMKLAYDEPEKYNLIVLHKYSRSKPERPEWLSYIGEGLKKSIECGQCREMDAGKAAFAIWSSFLGFNLMISRHTGLTFQEAESLFEVQIDIITKGILKKGV